MTSPLTIPYAPKSVSFRRRWVIRSMSLVAALLSTRSPERVAAILTRISRNTRPVDSATASELRREVTAVSLACAGNEGCLRRSITVALLTRLRGQWVTWCVGVRAVPPFAAHAWVAVDDEPIGENVPAGYFKALISVRPPADPR